MNQAITDTDSDGMDDAWETTNFGNLSQTASGDFDSDDMTNLEEYQYGFNPTVKDSLEDADGDRYPNIFELRGSADPNSASSTPSATYTVNGAGGGTHTTIGAAITSATTTNGAYQIIAIAAGTYTGTSNYNVTIASTKPKLLFIGLDGAAKTIIDGGNGNWGWTVSNTAVIASLTFQKTWQAFWIDAASKDVRLVDLIVRDNGTTSSYAAGAHINNAARVSIIGSTFLDNAGMSSAKQIYFAAGTNTVVNTVVYASGTGTMLAKGASATMTTNYCLVKGQTLTGTGNLSGSTDPKLLPDLHLKWDSPLRAAGGTVAQSRIDIDGELRPSSSPDIGVDQFVDSDADDVADRWEQAETGGLTTLTSRMQDADSDGLTNDQEYVGGTKPSVADTDGDGLSDGAEVSTHSTDPLKADTDGDDMPDGWEVTYGFAPLTANGLDDADGDRYPNVFEYAGGTNPTSASSTPTATYTVNGAGGGTHTTIGAALTSADVANGAYQIIAIAPGTYTGSSNYNVTIAATKPKLLFIGTDGASKTVIDGGNAGWGWNVYNTAVIASLTVQKAWQAIWIDAPSKEVRLVDLVVRDNGTTSSYAAGVQVNAAAKVNIVGSTFLDNAGMTTAKQIYFNAGTNTVLNTVVYATSATGTMLAKASGATMTTNYCLVKGQTLTGTGNLAGTTDPKFWYDVHLRWDSPLRSAGGTTTQSRIDIDGETRPSSTPDIGVDQFVDSDADELPDNWEQAKTGGLTTLTSRSQDADSDGLTNEQEFFAGTQPNVADTDGDGASDGAEQTAGSDPLKTDTDGDDMPDGWEITYGLSPLVANGFDDADGDRYPNVFEYARSTNPSSSSSIPTANYVVNGAGGGTHTTIGAAVSAADVANGAYQVIAVAPGVYTGSSNYRVTIAATKPKLLIIGVDGAGKTVIDGGNADWGWSVINTSIISSLTFQKTWQAIWIDAPSKEVRLTDLVVRDNGPTTQYAAAVHVNAATRVDIVGSTILDNSGMSSAKQIYFAAGTGNVLNTAVWASATGTMLAKAGGATMTTNYCLVKGQTLTGTGNLSGSTDPKFLPDLHLKYDSPLRAAGGTTTHSRIDIDGELRPSSAPDIGVDQFVDSDADQLADKWEQTQSGGLTTLTSRTQDADSDGLTNDEEYVAGTNPTATDMDGDGLSDGAELNTHGTSPFVADTDGDDMPDGWEVTYGLSPVTANAFDDDDGDSYPNVFEYARSSNPSDRASVPTANYVVDGAGGGTHTTMNAAITAANVSNGAYQIIGVAPGVYTGEDNVYDVDLPASKPKFLVIGLQGAGATIFDGESDGWGWNVYNSAVISSLTFRKTWGALWVNAPAKEVRFVDLIVRDNGPSSEYAAGVDVYDAAKVSIVGSTFLDNAGKTSAKQIYFGAGAGTLVNTVVWATATGTMMAKEASATLTTSYSLVKGQTLSGTGNLAGTVDPKLRSDARLRSDSPLRGAGGAVAQSRIDLDGELRPSSGRDIGVDQWIDTDTDGLPDAWEVAHYGSTSAIAGAADDDSDELNNVGEYDSETDPHVADTDGDLMPDGFEVAHSTNPHVVDTDEVVSDLNHDGVMDGVGFHIGYSANVSDSDGDSVSNEDEALMCTNPFRADTDGDGVADNTDKFPLDPLVSALPSNSSDVTAPVITLTAPWYAVEQ